jgi:hypothetical protein
MKLKALIAVALLSVTLAFATVGHADDGGDADRSPCTGDSCPK